MRYLPPNAYDGKNLLTAGPGSTVRLRTGALGYTWVISPRLVNQVTISLVRSASDGGQQITTGDPLTILAGTDQSQTGNGLDRADYIGSPSDKGNSPSNSRGDAPA